MAREGFTPVCVNTSRQSEKTRATENRSTTARTLGHQRPLLLVLHQGRQGVGEFLRVADRGNQSPSWPCVMMSPGPASQSKLSRRTIKR